MKSSDSGQFSQTADVFHGLLLLEKGAALAGYSAIISAYELEVPLPDFISVISQKHKQYHKKIAG
ncbi:hypothetical protein CC99x_006970 [Candidatus Berkiella cookevillensis]|nr:hypothetical protein [Candidatus Berkiella cookevillensis]MCS5708647.1 hypothetical protein [Candidatus Berkiella cookevillensis]